MRLALKLKDLRYLLALAQEKHFSKAASRCAVSQPTLSVAIQRLEQSLRQPLFERLGQEIQITAFGKEVVTKAQAIIDQVDELERWATEDDKPTMGTLAIGAIYTQRKWKCECWTYPLLVCGEKTPSP